MPARAKIAWVIALVCWSLSPAPAQDTSRHGAPRSTAVATPDQVGQPDHASASRTAWPAPVGHRQPRPADIPPAPTPKNGTDAALERLQRTLDGKLNICRGC